MHNLIVEQQANENASAAFESLFLPEDPAQPTPALTDTIPTRLHHFFERSVARTPTAAALICQDQRWTYADLEYQANQLARFLIRQGIRPGQRIGLLFERSHYAYVSLLAILKSGAVFVPLDLSFPADRLAFIADDARLQLILTQTAHAERVAGLGCPLLEVDAALLATTNSSSSRPNIEDQHNAPCYVIYTSGTTGRPKGVVVTHASVCNFIHVCLPIYEYAAHDRVYQGMTLAFDFSIEEVWPTFAVGATLVAGPTDHRRMGAGLTDFLINHQISVLCCVPTLLATLERDIPSLRTLLVGGEACPADLVERWSKPGRRMLNTYGPTETTVTASWSQLYPNSPVTIGVPLPTYSIHLLNTELQPVPEGSPGEICIGGPGVAVGYLNRPELTQERFIANPFRPSRLGSNRLYRTGDLGRRTADGEIEYLGRIDTQVKIRGYRIELSEIEAILLEHDDIQFAVVTPLTGAGGVNELAAYVTLRNGTTPNDLRGSLHSALRRRLPIYMVPSFIEILGEFPVLPSGKVARDKLPQPTSPRLRSGNDALSIEPAAPREIDLAAVWTKTFGGDISVEADFFLDLGGHSLIAAQVISQLRQKPALRNLSIGDLYNHPTIRRLAAHIDASAPAHAPATPRQRLQHSNRRVWACGLLQLVLLYLTFLTLSGPIALLWRSAPGSSVELLWRAGLSVSLLVLSSLLLPILAKWILVGRFRAGTHPLWGWFYCRWWLMRKFLQLAPVDFLAGSPLFNGYLRLLGAKIGQGCQINTARLQLPDLIEIGDGTSIGYGVDLEPFYIANGQLHLAPIRIGEGAYIGTNSVVLCGATIGNHARIGEQTLVSQNQRIPDHETWVGSPSRRVGVDAQLQKMETRSARGTWSAILQAGFACASGLLMLLPSLLLLPGLMFVVVDCDNNWFEALALTPVAGLIYVLTVCLVVALAKCIVMPSVSPGVFPLRSFFGLRKWFTDKLMLLSLSATNSLYATLYTAPWLRLLGARVGRRAEVSTVSNLDPDLLTLGSESFVADLAVIGAARYHAGSIALGETVVGTRSFVGNAACIPINTQLAQGSLIGVQSVPPTKPVETGSSWLGSPALFLPRRQASARFEESLTFNPSLWRVACRGSIEFLRVILPATLMYVMLLLGTRATFALAQNLPTVLWLLVLPGIFFASALAVTLLVALLKWLVVGRYRPRVEPMWSFFVWRTELITALYENVAVPWLVRWCTGTPWIRPILRLFGAHIGRRVYLETTFLTEFDLVHVGADASIGAMSSLQTHLFEDRVMKMSHVVIGKDSVVGPRAVVLYDAELQASSELEGLSLAMKGETLPEQSRWRGIPAGLVQ